MRGVVKKTLGGVEIKAEANPRDLPPIPPPRKPFVRDDNSGLPPLNKENPHPPIKEGPSVPYAGFSPKEVRELKKLRKTPLTPRTGK